MTTAFVGFVISFAVAWVAWVVGFLVGRTLRNIEERRSAR
jgi:hypothetical protein